MTKLLKKYVDEAIRLSKKYYKTGDTDLLDAYINAKEKAFGKDARWICYILNGITVKRFDCDEPYETYYKALEAFGFKVVDEDIKLYEEERKKDSSVEKFVDAVIDAINKSYEETEHTVVLTTEITMIMKNQEDFDKEKYEEAIKSGRFNHNDFDDLKVVKMQVFDTTRERD